ncbi:hypothetical protein K461DRAFT_270479 [Myriangium duriaei CBS 260.36]|uniref:Uncharacterized protein n=1 Tax=Myriangium duriaei CBS 260.36 TaxID=1168546 RepID=A0A9P4IZY0_9PEZI|nr:hypothetical protein K461DRAFT_270479 [Myriangium duriaei CBS 260.36]
MSKRKRTDFEDGIQNASGSKYGAIEGVDGTPQPISYDEEDNTPDTPPTPPGPYSYTAEKRHALYENHAAEQDEELSTNRDKKRQNRPRKRPSKPQLNHYFGQHGVFPEPAARASKEVGAEAEAEALSSDPATDTDNEPAHEAWTYLRAVRAEAEGLPVVYRAHDAEQHAHNPTTRRQSVEGFFMSDGACIAAPRAEETAQGLSMAQTAYYTALTQRFVRHRARLRRAQTQGGSDVEGTCAARLAKLEDPPSAVVGLGQDATLRLLTALDEALDAALGDETQGIIPPVLGRWAWALLGVLTEVGELRSGEVGVVRDLAKRAAWGMSWLRMRGGDELEVARRRALGVLGVEEGREGTMAMLESIVTVVGECYGQRDLLEGRLAWAEGL